MSQMYEMAFDHTRRAIAGVHDPSIQGDFAQMLDGVEFGLKQGDKSLTELCGNALVAMAIGLNRTITPEVATAIVDGLLEDGQASLAFINLGGGLHKRNNSRCVSTGPNPGDAACQSSPGGACYTIDGAGGCGGTSGYLFPWVAKA